MLLLIAGCGRLGSVLATRLSERARTLCYDTEPAAAERVARLTGGAAVDRAPAEPVLAFLTLPPAALVPALSALGLAPGSTAVNCATAAPTPPLAAALPPGVGLAWAKVVGHAREIARGEAPVLVVGAPGGGPPAALLELLTAVGKVVAGPEDLARRANEIAATEALRCAARLRQRLGDLPDPVARAAVACAATGTLRATVDDDLGPFARALLASLSQEPG